MIDDGDAVAAFGQHEGRLPSQLQLRADDQAEAGIVDLAGFADESKPQVNVFFAQNINGLPNFFDDEFAREHGIR